jgi:hypothetical protein
LTAVAVAAGNGTELGGESTTPWRYRIYGSLLLILTAFLLINHAKEFHLKKVIYLFPVLALCFNLFSTAYCYRKAERRLEQRKVSAYRWADEGKRLGSRCPQAEPGVIVCLKEAERMGLCTMPQYPLSEYKSTVRADRDRNRRAAADEILYAIETVKEKEGFLIVDGWAYLRPESALMESEDICLYLVNGETQWICKPNFERRFDIIDDTRKADCGFFAVIDKTELPAGAYRIEIGIKSRLKPNRPVFYVVTDRTVEL